ncbi:MAG: TonB-dependent receptor, partial [Psychroflexus sp.]
MSLFFSATAQDQQELPLLNLFEILETKHDITFNYVNEDLAALNLPQPNDNAKLEAVFKHIFKHTQVEISAVNDKNYTAVWQKYQTCFQIKNAYDSSPLSEVQVFVKEQRIGKTNSVGKFFLRDSSVNELKFTYPQFFSETFTVENFNSKNCSAVFLYPEQELEEVLVQTYLTKGIDLKNDFSILLKPSEFGVLPGLINADVLHSLQYVPGIVNTDESVAEINVRGGTNDQNLLLWNGARLYQGSHFFGMISALNPFAANRVQVSKNGSSAFHNEGVSSVISITSQTENITENSNLIHTNFLSTSVATSQKMNAKTSLQASARRSFTDVWASPTYQKMRNKVFQNTEIQNLQEQNQPVRVNENFYFADASVSVHHQIDDNNEFDFSVLGIQNKLEFDEVLETNGAEKRNNLSQQNLLGSFNFNRTWNAKQQTKAKFNTSFYELNAENQSVFSEQTLLQN